MPTPAGEPIPGDVTLANSTCPIPTAGNPGPNVQPNFVPPVQPITFPADGKYVLHYYAQDCAGTQELNFQQLGGSWTTNFYTQQINVDTTAPAISPSTLVLTGALTNGHYKVGEKVTLSYSCSDATSGVVLCGLNLFAPGTLNTGTITTQMDTHSTGTKSFLVLATDAAGNWSTKSVSYTVSK